MKAPMHFKLIQIVLLTASSAASTAALAHDGHGLSGSHWHVTDAWGFVALGLGLLAAIWFSKGGK